MNEQTNERTKRRRGGQIVVDCTRISTSTSTNSSPLCCTSTIIMDDGPQQQQQQQLLREPLLLQQLEWEESEEGSSSHHHRQQRLQQPHDDDEERGNGGSNHGGRPPLKAGSERQEEEEGLAGSAAAQFTTGYGDDDIDPQSGRTLWWIVAGLMALTLALTAWVGLQDNNNNNNNPGGNNNAGFPSLQHTAELAYLSELVYRFKNYDDDDTVCGTINSDDSLGDESSSSSSSFVSQLVCHWYHHDRIRGTQVLLVRTPNYWAIVFAGTDDLKTSLTDVTLYEVHPSFPRFNETNGYDPRIRIHAGFDKAVFSGIFANLTQHLHHHLGGKVRVRRWWWWPFFRPSDRASQTLYTTGHSLGAANAVLTALALGATRTTTTTTTTASSLSSTSSSSSDATSPFYLPPGTSVASINFGCPRIGNRYFRDYANRFLEGPNNTTSSSSETVVPIWRVVLGWDLVPRLPEFLLHVGHTIQLTPIVPNNRSSSSTIPNGWNWWKNASSATDDASAADSNASAILPPYRADAYYLHYGNPDLQYSGVPLGWSATPFLWVPGALGSHSIKRYQRVLHDSADAVAATTVVLPGEQPPRWVHRFVPTPPPPPPNASRRNNHHPDDVPWDDDFWADPPVEEDKVDSGVDDDAPIVVVVDGVAEAVA